MRTEVNPQQVYQHYQGGVYEVVRLVPSEVDSLPLVVYKKFTDLKEECCLHAISLLEWEQEVVVRGKRMKKYQRLS